MKHTRSHILSIILAALAAFPAYSQDTLRLTLSETVRMAQEQSPQAIAAPTFFQGGLLELAFLSCKHATQSDLHLQSFTEPVDQFGNLTRRRRKFRTPQPVNGGCRTHDQSEYTIHGRKPFRENSLAKTRFVFGKDKFV